MPGRARTPPARATATTAPLRKRVRPRPDGVATRAKLLGVAIDLFAERGHDGVSMRDIAAAGGATLPAIYYHFGDKRALYLAACFELFSAWGRREERHFRTGAAPQQRLFDYLVGVTDSLTHDRRFAGLLQREILERDVRGIRRLTRAIFRTHFAEVSALCREIGCDGDADLAAHTLYALVFGLAQLHLIGHELETGRKIAAPEPLVRHVLGVVLPGADWTRLRATPSTTKRGEE